MKELLLYSELALVRFQPLIHSGGRSVMVAQQILFLLLPDNIFADNSVTLAHRRFGERPVENWKSAQEPEIVGSSPTLAVAKARAG